MLVSTATRFVRKGFGMTDSKPSVGTWVWRGLLAGPVLLFVYMAALGPLCWLHGHGPWAWRDGLETIVSVVYAPAFFAIEELLPEWVTEPYGAWLAWCANE
jgi:hypothetical protein